MDKLFGVSVGLLLTVVAAMAPATVLAHVHYPNSRFARPAEPLLFHVHGLAFSPDGKALFFTNSGSRDDISTIVHRHTRADGLLLRADQAIE